MGGGEVLAEEVTPKLKSEKKVKLNRFRIRLRQRVFSRSNRMCKYYMPKWAQGFQKTKKLCVAEEYRKRAGKKTPNK